MRKFCAILCWIILCSAVCAQAQAPAKKASGDKTKIESMYQNYVKAFNAKDVNGIMASYAPGNQLFVFDVVPPRQYAGWDAYKKDWEELFAGLPGPLSETMSDLEITVVGSVAYAHNIQAGYFTTKDGTKMNLTVRVTDVWRKLNGKWLIVQEHVSVPVDLMTGKADLLSKP